MSKLKAPHKGYYQLFFKKVMAHVNPLIHKVLEEKKETIRDSFEADLLGLEWPETDKSNKKPDELFLVNLFYNLMEIHDTFERIKECKHYISVFPFNEKKVSRSGYLSLINESFYHELYILKERLTAFTLQSIKKHKGTKYYNQGKKISDGLSKGVKKAMKNATDIRDVHVHRRRVEEKNIKILTSLELLQKSEDKDFATEIRHLYIQKFKDTRNEIKKVYAKAVKDIEELLDYYFFTLDSFFFENNTIKYPRQENE